MKNLFVCLVGFSAVLFCGCETTKTTKSKENQNKTYTGASFEVLYPPSISAVAEQGEEFAVHYFRLAGSKSMLGIYEGQRPKLFSKKERDLTVMRRGTTTRENIERGDDAWGVDSNGRIWRESVWSGTRIVHVANGKTYRMPTMLHIWYFGASEDEADLYNDIVDTLEMKR